MKGKNYFATQSLPQPSSSPNGASAQIYLCPVKSTTWTSSHVCSCLLTSLPRFVPIVLFASAISMGPESSLHDPPPMDWRTESFWFLDCLTGGSGGAEGTGSFVDFFACRFCRCCCWGKILSTPRFMAGATGLGTDVARGGSDWDLFFFALGTGIMLLIFLNGVFWPGAGVGAG